MMPWIMIKLWCYDTYIVLEINSSASYATAIKNLNENAAFESLLKLLFRNSYQKKKKIMLLDWISILVAKNKIFQWKIRSMLNIHLKFNVLWTILEYCYIVWSWLKHLLEILKLVGHLSWVSKRFDHSISNVLWFIFCS